MKNKRLNDKTLFIAAIVLIAAVTAFLSYIKIKEYVEVRGKISTEKRYIKDNEARIKEYAKLQEDMVNLQAREERAINLIPDKRDESGIMKCMSAVGLFSGLSITNMSFEKDENKDSYIRIPIKLSAQGKYSDMSSFISELLMTYRMFKIDTLRVERNENSGSALKIEIDASAYYTIFDSEFKK